MDRMRPYMPTNIRDIIHHRTEFDVEYLKFSDARGIFRDFTESFNRYMQECHFPNFSRAAGLQMKIENSIVRPRPIRPNRNMTQRDFDLLHASGHTGSERYVEWKSLV